MVKAGDGYMIYAPIDEIDLHQSIRLIGQARDAVTPVDRMAMLDKALELWRGPVLADVATDRLRQRVGGRYQDLYYGALETWATTALETGEYSQVVARLPEVVEAAPTKEMLATSLALALYRSGDQTGALRVIDLTRDRLAEELGLDPGPDLQTLRLRMLRHDPSLIRRAQISGPAQLPRDVPDFVGRSSEFAHLIACVEAKVSAPSATVIFAIDGMAGVGKTALAVHAAHRLAARFPDGQLFLDLHAHSAGQKPLTPESALAVLLHAVGVPGEQLPQALAERAALWRTETADRHLLVILDNVADVNQVRDLVPGSAGCLTLVTSRRRLAELAGASSLALDVLPEAEAGMLFEAIVGQRAAEERRAAHEVVRLCGRLPLAIRLAASRLNHRPRWTVAHLVHRLGRERQRLAELSGPEGDVAAAFAMSYSCLSQNEQRMFRLLSLSPGTDTDAYAAAALAHLPEESADLLLESLLDVHLVDQRVLGRYSLHDLLRDHSRACLDREESQSTCDSAVLRVLDFYLYAARCAADQIQPGRQPIDLALQWPPDNAPVFPDSPAAVAWFSVERLNLVAAVHQAVQWAKDRHAWLLARDAGVYYSGHGEVDSYVETHELAVAAANRLADGFAEQLSRLNLSAAYRQSGRLNDALEHALRALQTSDQPLAAQAHRHVAIYYSCLGQYASAFHHYEEALAAAEATRDDHEKGYILANWALALINVGDCEHALDLLRDVAFNHHAQIYPNGSAFCHLYTGAALSGLRRYDEALETLAVGLNIASGSGRRNYEAEILAETAEILSRREKHEDALANARRGLQIAEDTGLRTVECQLQLAMGNVRQGRGEHRFALTSYRRSFALAQSIGYRHLEARALNGMAHAEIGLGHHVLAQDRWQKALALYGEMQTPDVNVVEAHLTSANAGHAPERGDGRVRECRCADGANYHAVHPEPK